MTVASRQAKRQVPKSQTCVLRKPDCKQEWWAANAAETIVVRQRICFSALVSAVNEKRAKAVTIAQCGAGFYWLDRGAGACGVLWARPALPDRCCDHPSFSREGADYLPEG